jgi:hypothetical protein
MATVNIEPKPIQRYHQLIKPGDISFSSFSPGELKPGWYHANNDKFPTTSEQGKALKGLSADYKARWGIVEEDGYINLPNMYAEDGRGYFVRAGETPGVTQGDTSRNITGSINALYQIAINTTPSGAYRFISSGPYAWSYTESSTHKFTYAQFDASIQVPTGPENKPINVAMIPVVFLDAYSDHFGDRPWRINYVLRHASRGFYPSDRLTAAVNFGLIWRVTNDYR